MDIFAITKNDNFFSILASPNKKLYWSVLCGFYEAIIAVHERKISRMQAKMFAEQILEEASATNADASDIIKKLSDDGWLLIQYDGIKSCDYITFSPYAMEFLRFNYNYTQNNNSIKTSEILNTIMHIVKELYGPADNKSDIYLYPYRQGLLRIRDLTKDLMNELYGIITKMQTSIAGILKTEDMQDLVQNLSEYLKEIDNGYIANMYRHSNITIAYKHKLEELLTLIKSDTTFQERIINDMKAYLQTGTSDETLFVNMSELLDEIQLLFCENYQECRRKIESLKSDILNHAHTKLQMLSSDRSSNVAKINKIIGLFEKIAENDEEAMETVNSLFKITTTVSVSSKSIYNKTYSTPPTKPQPVIADKISDEEFENAFHSIPDSSMQANRFAEELLDGKKEIEVKLLGEEHINKIIAIASYADYPNCKYTIEILDEKIQIGNILTNNFIIRRAEK